MSWRTDWLADRSRITPNRIAVVDAETGKQWSYRQLHQQAEQLAAILQNQGVVGGDRVALIAPNHLSYFELLFACAKIGAIFVPLNWRLSHHELNEIIQDCRPKLLCYDQRFQELADRLFVQQKMDHQSWKNLASPRKEKRTPPEMEAPWMILYTGGTTGRPKGVVLSHTAVFWNAINTLLSWRLTAEDITLVYLPMFHTGGLNTLALPLLYAGGTVVIADKFSAEQAIEVINRERCTIILMVPTMYHLFTQSPLFAHSSFPSMRVFLSGGAPCPLSIYRAFQKKGIPFKEGYGLTEAGPNNFQIEPEMAQIKQGSVGLPMLFNEIRLMNEEKEITHPEEVGEIWIRGGHLFDYYWENTTATQAALHQGWLLTGDLGKRDEEGYYYIVGRKKEMIITGGENVYPLEVEKVIDQHPAVAEVCVVGLPDEQWGEVVTAVIVLVRGRQLTEVQMQDYLRKQLGKYKVPKKIFFTEKLPKTPVGKIDRKGIIKKYG